jgi:hypothetical protein
MQSEAAQLYFVRVHVIVRIQFSLPPEFPPLFVLGSEAGGGVGAGGGAVGLTFGCELGFATFPF